MGTTTAPQTSAPAAARSHLRLVIALAAVLRVAMAVFFFRATDQLALTKWGYENISIAFALVSGKGFSSPFYFPSGPTAFMAPGYPLLIAAFMYFLGSGKAATLSIIAFQILLSLLTVVLVHRVAKRFFGMRAANIAALFCAIMEPLLIAPLYIWDTCLSALILTAALAIASDLRRRRDFNVAGLACAAVALINPALLPTLIAIVAWSAWRARLIPWLGTLIFLLALSPWPIRNYAAMHAFVPLRDNFGYELWHGNHPGSDGEVPPHNTPMTNVTERSLFQTHGEISYMRQKNSLAKNWIQGHPAEFARLTLLRFVRFWSGTSESSPPLGAPLVAAAFAGLLLLWRSRQLFALFAIPLVIFPLPYYITHAEVRFQFILDPLLAILAGYACDCLFAWCSRRSAPQPALTAGPN